MQKTANLDEMYNNIDSTKKSASAMAYEQFKTLQENRVEFRSKFASKNFHHPQELNPSEMVREQSSQYQATERTNMVNNDSPVKKQQ